MDIIRVCEEARYDEVGSNQRGEPKSGNKANRSEYENQQSRAEEVVKDKESYGKKVRFKGSFSDIN